MNEAEKIVARLWARRTGRAVVVRQARTFSNDPDDVIAIAAIKVVTEDQVQAIAFGSPTGTPQVITRLHPMGRDTADFEPFAEWLASYVERTVNSDGMVRVWVPTAQTVDILSILGRRYENNVNASPRLRTAARYCRILAEETRYAGQQTIAIAHGLLLDHVVTGQMPIEDHHLGAVMAWVEPVSGRNVQDVAAERARLPASGILVNTPDQPDDDRVERLRKEMKSALPSRRDAIQTEITRILASAVLREWSLLTEARRAFWRLGLPEAALAELNGDSKGRVSWAVTNPGSAPRRAVSLARHLEKHEHAIRKLDRVLVREEKITRNLAKRLGRVIEGTVVHIEQPRPNYKPCTLIVETTQPALRVRLDDHIDMIGHPKKGIVRTIDLDPISGRTLVHIEISAGVRGAHRLLGETCEWAEDNDYPIALRHKTLTEAAARQSWIVENTAPPGSRPIRLPAGDLLDLAHQSRRRP